MSTSFSVSSLTLSRNSSSDDEFWLGSPQRKPLVIFIHGAKSSEMTNSLGDEYKIKVIHDSDTNFEATLLEGIRKCFHVIVHAQSETTNPNTVCQFLSRNCAVNYQMHSVFLDLKNSNKEGYSTTIQPNYDHLKTCLKSPLDKIAIDSHKSIFELFGEEDHVRFDLLRRQLLRKIPHTFAALPSDQYRALESLSALELPQMRAHIPEIDGHESVRPYMHNEYKLPNGIKTSASEIPFKKVDPTCIDFISTHCPSDTSFEVFWTMVDSLPSTCVIQLNYEFGSFIPGIGEEMTKGDLTLSTIEEKILMGRWKETLIQSHITLKNGDVKKNVTYFWIKEWVDGSAIRDEKVLDQLLDTLHERGENDPNFKPVVFCTAGVGRTGTFLASYLIKHLTVWNSMNHRLDQIFLPLYVTLFLRLHRTEAVGSMSQFYSLSRLNKGYLGTFEDD